MGEVLTIRGTHFGDAREDSYVSIAGIIPTASSYIEWKNDRIAVRIPEFGDSGLVYIHSGNKKSNAALFTNRATMPQLISGSEEGDGPRILSVDPLSGRIGSAVTIQGRNFGASRENGRVVFAWDAESPPSAPASVRGPGRVEVFESEFGYEVWSDREIRVRVPDGAVSGNLEVITGRGNGSPVFFDVAERPGTKIFKDKRSYAVSYAVDVKAEKVVGPNTLYLWVPTPQLSSSQRSVQRLSRSTEPFVEEHRGTSLFQFKDLSEGSAAGVQLSYLVDVYAVETQVRPQAIKRDAVSPIRAAYTLPTPLIPSDDGEIAKLAARIVAKEKNPYLQARRLYEWLTAQGGITAQPVSHGAREAAAGAGADAYAAALLFCAMARSLEIPAIPVSGFLVDRSRKATRHFWAEFWIDGFGWVPVDPALGSGAAPESFSLRSDAASYYFGNLDNQRITFSRGQTGPTQMDPRGRTTQRTRDYSLQTLWEEAIGGLESYSSLWGDLVITGIY